MKILKCGKESGKEPFDNPLSKNLSGVKRAR